MRPPWYLASKFHADPIAVALDARRGRVGPGGERNDRLLRTIGTIAARRAGPRRRQADALVVGADLDVLALGLGKPQRDGVFPSSGFGLALRAGNGLLAEREVVLRDVGEGAVRVEMLEAGVRKGSAEQLL